MVGEEINPKSALIVYCPLSGPRHTKENLRHVRRPLEDLLQKQGIEHRFESDLLPYDAVREYGKDKKYIILLGGESAAHFSCQTMMEQGHGGQTAVFFPFGSGNDFLRSLNIYSNDDAMTAFKGHLEGGGLTKKVDILSASLDGELTRYYGTNMIGFGLNSSISRKATPEMKKKLGGKIAYYLATFKVLFKDYKVASAKVTGSGVEAFKGDILSLMFCNGPYAGAGMKAVPWAQNDDGIIEMFAVNYMSRLKLALIFPKVYSGSHVKVKQCHFAQGKQFLLQLDRPMPMQIDGEVIKDVKTAEILIHPKEMEFVYLPPKVQNVPLPIRIPQLEGGSIPRA